MGFSALLHAGRFAPVDQLRAVAYTGFDFRTSLERKSGRESSQHCSLVAGWRSERESCGNSSKFYIPTFRKSPYRYQESQAVAVTSDHRQQVLNALVRREPPLGKIIRIALFNPDVLGRHQRTDLPSPSLYRCQPQVVPLNLEVNPAARRREVRLFVIAVAIVVADAVEEACIERS